MMMPCVAGRAPVPIVACPAHVTVFRYGYNAALEDGALGEQTLEPALELSLIAIEIVEPHLIDDDQ